MKKLLLFISITLLSVVNVSAQCVPDPQFTSSGIFPNEATGFVSGCVGTPYEQLVTNVVPPDTTTIQIVLGQPIPITVDIDSIVITGVSGLPPGLSISFYDAQNTNSPPDLGCYEGGTIGCALISGTPTTAGSYDLNITVVAYVSLVGQQPPTAIDWYTIVIEDVPTITLNGTDFHSSAATGNQWYLDGNLIPSANGQVYTPVANGSYTVEANCGTSSAYMLNNAGINENTISNFRLFPNPSESTITINGLNGANFEGVVFTNLSGAIVKTIDATSNTNQTIDVSDLENGVYLVQVKNSGNTEVIRFVKK